MKQFKDYFSKVYTFISCVFNYLLNVKWFYVFKKLEIVCF